MNNTQKQFKDAAQLAIVKAAVDAIAEPVKAQLVRQLAAMGIEAEVELRVNTLSVNLDTMKSQAGKRRK